MITLGLEYLLVMLSLVVAVVGRKGRCRQYCGVHEMQQNWRKSSIVMRAHFHE